MNERVSGRESANSREKCILHLDDSRIALKLVKKVFEGFARVIGVTQLVDAIAIVERTPMIDCFLVDYGLDEGNGFDFIRVIREMDAYKDTPIILLSSGLTNKVSHRAMRLGVNCSLPKIISNQDLLKEVQSQLINPQIKIIQKEYHEVYCVQWEHDGVYFQYSPDINIIVSSRNIEETQGLMEYKLKDMMNGIEFDVDAIHEMSLRRHLIYTPHGESTQIRVAIKKAQLPE